MPVSGDLRHTTLTQLISLACDDPRESVLLLQGQDHHFGVIAFANGEIVHAAVGSQLGDAALQQLLDWQHGTFELEHRQAHHLPERTVRRSWRALLPTTETPAFITTSELAIGKSTVVLRPALPTAPQTAKLTRDPLPPASVPAPMPEAREINEALAALEHRQAAMLSREHQDKRTRDHEREYYLIRLVAELEQMRVGLTRGAVKRQPQRSFQSIADMVNATSSYLNKTVKQTKRRVSLTAVINKTAIDYEGARLLTVNKGLLSVRQAEDYFKRQGDSITRRQAAYRDVMQGLLNVLKTLLYLVLSLFETKEVATSWTDTVRVFYNEVQRLVSDIAADVSLA